MIILTIIGIIQVLVIIFAFGLALGRASVINKWKTYDFFWFRRLEKLFTKLLTPRQ